ncbi:MATE family efflux transporter [Aestuariibacter sp. AA17]|uniref:Multidrug-efflux transporter n=1 Tax=Fluctibacter corallii TaxID=2984329 RepID=A0ABT3A5X1_9ALTE|nr:MATE family efflux transporter [Aestuariibacter sp. AA17]MCV2884008.1 MATE family efflux transporter [Aestuariibacter sp. AA17]
MSIKHELKKVSSLAWPLLIAQVTQTLMGVSDTIMAGRYSAQDMAAVAIGYSITLPVLFFIQGIIFALPPIISRLQGAKQDNKIAYEVQQTFWLVLPLSLLVFAFAPFLPVIFSYIEMEAGLRTITVDYITYLLWSAPVFAVYQVLRNFCEGLSDTRPTMLIMLLGLAVNIPANYVLIYGKFGLPAMGGAGCGLATALVFFAMMIATFVYIKKAKKYHSISLFMPISPPKLSKMWTIFRLGFPIAMTILFEVTLFGVVALLLSPLGSDIVAAHQIALNFSSVMFMLPLSIGMAISIRVGYLIGENQLHTSHTAVKSALLLGISISLCTASITVLARFFIAGLYTTEQEVLLLATNLMFLAALFQFSDAIQVISAGALRGYKDTKAMLYITFVAYWLIGLPIGYSLGRTDILMPAIGAAGFWIGFICGLTSAAIMLGIRLLYLWRSDKHLA